MENNDDPRLEASEFAVTVAGVYMTKGDERTSAIFCYQQATDAFKAGEYFEAYRLAKKSIEYSMGIHHDAYRLVLDMAERFLR